MRSQILLESKAIHAGDIPGLLGHRPAAPSCVPTASQTGAREGARGTPSVTPDLRSQDYLLALLGQGPTACQEDDPLTLPYTTRQLFPPLCSSFLCRVCERKGETAHALRILPTYLQKASNSMLVSEPPISPQH